MSQWSHLTGPDPEFAAAFARLPPAPPHSEDPAVFRERFKYVVSLCKKNDTPRLPAADSYRVQDYEVPVTEGNVTVRAIIPVAPEGEDKTYPVMLWIHGGGWAMGNLEPDDFWMRRVSVELQISIVMVDYRLAPEFPFPTGLNDCYEALKWTALHTDLIFGSLSKGFLITGQSAGGNLAGAIAHRARDDPFFADKKVTGQLLQIPCTTHPDAVPEKYKSQLLSFEENKDAPFLSAWEVRMFIRTLHVPPEDPDFNLLMHPSHRGLAPAYIQVCGLDPTRDYGMLYEQVLREEGVRTMLDVYPGVPHGFHFGYPHIAAGKKWDADFLKGLRWLLQQG
ncbi:hypothetical protein CERSUDRAFT_124589 [Gelatoporia subvermispora B]|uniref:Alpha/beta hydrolase fold-3 domain-containing protein n=1 Tax=Ceriporiopsis subvermispora (strain B) TaxID=914234 RepID=M2QVF7_CERS8|nr:hypothetical protein CERSUDRAFT_124589 [Gelatoporia subvermispora B]